MTARLAILWSETVSPDALDPIRPALDALGPELGKMACAAVTALNAATNRILSGPGDPSAR